MENENKVLTLSLLNDFFLDVKDLLNYYVEYESHFNSINPEQLPATAKETLVNLSIYLRKKIKLAQIQAKALFKSELNNIDEIIKKDSFKKIILDPLDIELCIVEFLDLIIKNKVEEIIISNQDIINKIFDKNGQN